MTQWGLDTLFNPAKRHMDEEKRRLQSTREEAGDSSGGRRIDLESGKVVIRRDADEATDGDEPATTESTATESTATESTVGESDGAGVDGAETAETPTARPNERPHETAAQRRARERRARNRA